ncbi:polysaccharide deacetylase family protein [Microbacterium sp. BWT-B31]|uniref:polysaccharide deacetylase family protein n=1 Tax=Microbacterium sp. BWT-B31 TaxID=3232072 RepID=UPI003527A9DA
MNPSPRLRRNRRIAAAAAVVVVIVGVGVTVGFALMHGSGADLPNASASRSPAPDPVDTPTPTPTALTAAEALLAGSADPAACAVSFEGDGIDLAPQLQVQGAMYAALPIPDREGEVFAGWYGSPADAAAHAIAGRVNGSREVACADRQITLYGAWMSPDDNAAENAQIPIMMYHQFTTNPDGESGWLRGNYAYIGDFDAHMAYIAESGFYLPTWDELAAFIDGRLFLPDHSVIITDDDADHTWLELAVPVVDKYRLLTTSFVITVWRSEPTPSKYVLQRSHTHEMHESGANGQGLMVNWSAEQIAADLETSASILGAKEVVAYPFGHYNETTKEGMRMAGFELGRTIEGGYVHIGTDKLALPVVRINYGMGVGLLPELIG